MKTTTSMKGTVKKHYREMVAILQAINTMNYYFDDAFYCDKALVIETTAVKVYVECDKNGKVSPTRRQNAINRVKEACELNGYFTHFDGKFYDVDKVANNSNITRYLNFADLITPSSYKAYIDVNRIEPTYLYTITEQDIKNNRIIREQKVDYSVWDNEFYPDPNPDKSPAWKHLQKRKAIAYYNDTTTDNIVVFNKDDDKTRLKRYVVPMEYRLNMPESTTMPIEEIIYRIPKKCEAGVEGLVRRMFYELEYYDVRYYKALSIANYNKELITKFNIELDAKVYTDKELMQMLVFLGYDSVIYDYTMFNGMPEFRDLCKEKLLNELTVAQNLGHITDVALFLYLFMTPIYLVTKCGLDMITILQDRQFIHNRDEAIDRQIAKYEYDLYGDILYNY